MPDIEARIKVLEKLSETCEAERQDVRARFESERADINGRFIRMEEKLDEHLIKAAETNMEMTQAVVRLSTTLETLGEKINEVIPVAALALKHETIATTVIKVAGVISGVAVTLASGAWAIFTWLN